MGGTFWGEYLDEANGKAESDSPTSTRNANEYAKQNVESFFNTVRSQRRIKDPLLWWKNNQNQFPELAMLARKWICASSVYGRPNSRDNEYQSSISTAYSDPDTIGRMVFLHDNNNLI